MLPTGKSLQLKDVSEGYDSAGLGPMASGFGMCQFILHAWSALSTRDPQMFLMHGIAFLYDVFFLSMAVMALEGLRRHVLTDWKRTIDTIAKVVVFALGLVLASYPLLLTEFLGFPVNAFAVGTGIGRFSLNNILGSRVALAMAGAATAAIVCVRCSFRIPLLRKRLVFGVLTSLCLFGVILSVGRWKLMGTHPHPLVYSVQESLKGWFVRGERVVPRPARPALPEGQISLRLEPSPVGAATTFRYDHVLFLVMETVNESRFAQRFMERGDGFYSKVKDRACYFKRYYATNLDSYSSLLAMLTSVQVPYRAYEAPGYFSGVNKAPNVIGALGGKGWRSLFVCTSEHSPFVPLRQLWTSTVHGRDLPHEGRVSLGLNPIEAAVEDKAAIPSMVSFMKAHRQTVIMHEMVFGHSPRWKALTGKEQLEYYDEFFQGLYDSVHGAGLGEKTLFVIVADHGNRTDSAVAENYRVPLLVVGGGVEPSVDDHMFSHLDLQQIVGHYLCGLPLPRGREDVLVVGHSGRWVYGQITIGGSCMFIDAFDGVVISQEGDLLPQRIFDRFQMEIDSFAHYQRAR